jgi:two-component system, OmpR family, sensor histidine kinase ChvG
MASDIDIARPEPAPRPRPRGPRWWARLPVSRLGRTIIALNVLGLAILVTGALVLNEQRQALLNASLDGLEVEGKFIRDILNVAVTEGEPEPALNADAARVILLNMPGIPKTQRVRIFDAQGRLVADSYNEANRIESRVLPPLRKPGGMFRLDRRAVGGSGSPRTVELARKALEDEAKRALQALPEQSIRGTRVNPAGDRVVSISLPISHVVASVGVLTLEGANVDQIITNQRLALLPFIAIAFLTTLISSFMLNRVIARPVRRLAHAADQVSASRARAISLPDISSRNDELGDLAHSLETMTISLSERLDAIERFAADVAHEIRNPLTSIRSAVETLDVISDPAAKAKLTAILKQDVSRLDRLITDISNFSRLDAELSRDAPRPVDLGRLLSDIVGLYDDETRPGEVDVRVTVDSEVPVTVAAREGPLGQVFRNLIENARSFAPLSKRQGRPEVRVTVRRTGAAAMVTVDDDGPGIPPDNLETVFERFYTSRPKGAAFGGNSGLGLSIARQIVTAHGGRIWAENRTGPNGEILGARFIVVLPARGPA